MFALTIISMISTLASGAMQARASYLQGKQAQATAKYNAAVKEQEATQIAKKRQADAKIERDAGDRRLAKMRAAYARSGVALEGSPLDFMQQEAENQEFNIQERNRLAPLYPKQTSCAPRAIKPLARVS